MRRLEQKLLGPILLIGMIMVLIVVISRCVGATLPLPPAVTP